VLERKPAILGREEPELARRLGGLLAGEGVELQSGVEIERVRIARDPAGTGADAAKVVRGTVGEEQREWHAAEIVVAGRPYSQPGRPRPR